MAICHFVCFLIGFGAPTSTSSNFGFGTPQNANPFGANQVKPFGSTSQPLFGTTTNTTQSGFGTGLFGQTTTQVIILIHLITYLFIKMAM